MKDTEISSHTMEKQKKVGKLPTAFIETISAVGSVLFIPPPLPVTWISMYMVLVQETL